MSPEAARPPAEHAPTRARGALLVGVFAASILWVLVGRGRVDDGATAADFVAAARASAARIPPGATVLVHPPWRDDVVDALRAAAVLPGGAVATTAFAPRHGEPLPPLVILSDRAAPPLPRVLRGAAAEVHDIGPIRIALLAGAPGSGADGARRDLAASIAHASVHVERADGSRVDCGWSPLAARHTCPSLPDWMHVGVEELPVGGRTVRCTWAHPISGGALVIAFPGAELGDDVTLELALTDGAADNKSGAPVNAALTVDGASLLELSTTPGRRGFTRRTAPSDGRRDGDLTLRITTADDGQRHACFRLSTGAR